MELMILRVVTVMFRRLKNQRDELEQELSSLRKRRTKVDGDLGDGVRLEQERIGYRWEQRALSTHVRDLDHPF